jgi:AcrB/AcrD/AcrF family/Outer membrane efflux protein
MRKLSMIKDVSIDQQNSGLEALIEYDRPTAARFGITPQLIDQSLYGAFGQAQVSTIYTSLNQYHVVMEAAPQYTQSPLGLSFIYVHPATGNSVPLDAFVHATKTTSPLAVNHDGLFPAVIVSFNLAPGASLGQATVAIEQLQQRLAMPRTVHGGFAATAGDFKKSTIDQIVPVMPVPPAFNEQGPQQAPDGSIWKPAQPQDAELRGRWWEIYQEPELNTLEEKIAISNQNVAQAFANFMAARAQVGQARSSYYPTISIGPSYFRGRSSQTTTTSFNSTNNANTNLFNLPFDVSWEPDLWGRIRNTVQQYSYAAQVSAADLANQTLTEQANLAIYYFELRGQDTLEELYRKTAEVDRQSLALTRVNTGLDWRTMRLSHKLRLPSRRPKQPQPMPASLVRSTDMP